MGEVRISKVNQEKVCFQIENKNEHYASHANKGRSHVTFESGDWV